MAIINKKKDLGRKSLGGKFRTGKEDMRKESKNRLGNFLALEHIIEELQRNTAGCLGILPEELNINQKGSFITNAAFPRGSSELVITEYLADNNVL